jgi:hypothetical protein
VILDEHLTLIPHMNYATLKARRTRYSINDKGLRAGIQVATASKLINSTIRPVLEYASAAITPLLKCNNNLKAFEKADTIYRSAFRTAIRCPRTASNAFLEGETGFTPLQYRRKQHILDFLEKLVCRPSSDLQLKIFNISYRNATQGKMNWSNGAIRILDTPETRDTLNILRDHHKYYCAALRADQDHPMDMGHTRAKLIYLELTKINHLPPTYKDSFRRGKNALIKLKNTTWQKARKKLSTLDNYNTSKWCKDPLPTCVYPSGTGAKPS